jgi:small subunit ribosomal protein S1
VTVSEITSGGIEVSFGEQGLMKAFIRKSDLSRDRGEQRPERFAVGDKVDARVTNVDRATRRLALSIKALEVAEEQEAVQQYGSTDSGASLGDILGAALRQQGAARAEASGEPDFDGMTKAQLIEYAEANGIEVAKSDKVGEIRDAIKAAV